MYLNADMMKESLNLCDEAYKEYTIALKILQDKGYLSLYNEHGESHAGLMTIPEWLLVYRTFINSYWPEDIVKQLEDAYSQEDNENDVTPSFKDDTALLKQLSNIYVTTTKDRNPDLTEEEIKSKDKEWWFDENQGPYNYSLWMADKNKSEPAPTEAVTYWNNYTVTNDWKIERGSAEEYFNDKTVEEVKARVIEIVDRDLGEPLVSQNVQPVDYDEKGGLIFNKNMEDADDEDTFLVGNSNGGMVPVDGMKKAISTAAEYRKVRVRNKLALFVYRKVTEPDGYFAWRAENIADFL